MLLPRNTNPLNTSYYFGAVITGILKDKDDTSIEFLSLFEETKNKCLISMQSFILALDWLYILGSIKTDTIGNIKKCF
jgi:hypothetical protein